MRYFLFSFILILLYSCTTSKKDNITKQNEERLKELALCKCLTYSINKVLTVDTIDQHLSERLLIEVSGLDGDFLYQNYFPLLDSAANSIATQALESKFAAKNKVAEGTQGRVAYKYLCFDFYKSKGLDSLVKVISKAINDSLYADPEYKK